ncbi:Type IV secretory system Conjugative DNA transfer [Arenibacter nanhaiticus]|uniref:Type IV secretory system Conjugative DNA transfer n=1 Tax=Arenibacter nanhaiticus TaxID=558155 RepID=A0A1M6L160_9FLAO|nr:type IV secretory system conjugative DNA transfer family protein [Arenibacter nanhaiticus]SHJ64879.1 Type IV secretory system Conjugative DNA transfer [Arenibacter nanhaiticus]
MNNQNLAFSAMLLSVSFFVILGIIPYYPLLQYLELDSPLFGMVHDFLGRFKTLQKPFLSRSLLLLIVLGSVMLYNPRKKESSSLVTGFVYFSFGALLLFITAYFKAYQIPILGYSLFLYCIGFLFSVIGAVHLFQVMDFTNEAEEDPFNEQNESFRQMEEKIDTKYSVNIPYEYRYRGQLRKGWVNFVNLFRALLVIGTPGSGKSFALIEEIIEQMITKNYTMLIYDFKFDTLSKIAYNYWRRKKELPHEADPLHRLPEFYILSFDNIEKSHRCNPIDPYLMQNQTDASDAATIIMKNLNREWIKRGDFFSKSAISFVAGLIWYLKKKSEETGEYICTLPHVITLSTINIEYLLEIMMQEVEVRSLMIPFKDAMERKAGQQLAGQTASAQISLSMLASKEIYYIMTGNDFQLDINNPQSPKIVCIQNNPDRSEIYAAPIGLYINKALQVVNKPGCRPMGLILDELPTVFIMGLRRIIDTGRAHYVATVLGIQSISQLIADYGRELAEVIFDNCSNVFSGAAKGETARRISEIFGRIHQEKRSKAVSNQDTTVNFSTILSSLLPKSKITSMSTGHFAGIVADTFEHPITQKLCCGLLKPNMEAKKIQDKYELPSPTQFINKHHQELVASKMTVLQNLNFFEVIKHLDFGQRDHRKFYGKYLDQFTKERYSNPIKQMQFIPIAREIKLFDHLHKLKSLTIEDTDTINSIKKFITALVDRMFIEQEKNRVLEKNFMKVIQDINTLVEREYSRCTGKKPKLPIFDKTKIGGEIGTSLEKNDLIAKGFITDFHSRAKKALADSFRKQYEIPNFGKFTEANQLEPGNVTEKDLESLFSSFPIIMDMEN